jgi:uncharacterized protein (TIGR03435 family)
MKRTTRIAVGAALLIAPIMMALPEQSPSFEVATVRPYKDDATAGGVVFIGGGCRGVDSPTPGQPGAPGAGGGGGGQQMTVMIGAPAGGGAPAGPPAGARGFGPPTTPIGRCRFTRMNLKQLINNAYRLTQMGGSIDQMISGGPAWVGVDTFDIEAKAENPEQTNSDQLRAMLGNLLADRFKLKFHREKREMPGFDLLVGKNGLKMKPAAEGDPAGPDGGGMRMGMRGPGQPTTMSSQRATIANIIGFLSGRLGRAINDKTGLTGNYNFSLSWTPGEGEAPGLGGMTLNLPGGARGSDSASEPGVSLFTALQEQMGLRLEASKVMLDVFVIDSAEKPVDPQ